MKNKRTNRNNNKINDSRTAKINIIIHKCKNISRKINFTHADSNTCWIQTDQGFPAPVRYLLGNVGRITSALVGTASSFDVVRYCRWVWHVEYFDSSLVVPPESSTFTGQSLDDALCDNFVLNAIIVSAICER